MPDFQILLSAGVVLVGFLAWTAVLRAVSGGEPMDLGRTFGDPWELTWPRGVQEEELQPWRLDLLDRRLPVPTQLPRATSPSQLPEERAA
jgi:hypothetical protein